MVYRRGYRRLLNVVRTTTVFVMLFVLVFSPLMNEITPFLPRKIADKFEVKEAFAALDSRIYIKVASGSLSGAQSNGNWTVPYDWNPASNSIEVIGAGGGGGDGSGNQGGGGGGGGGYSRINNLSFAEASTSIPFSVGASGSGGNASRGGNGGHTWFGKINFGNVSGGCFSAGTSVCVSAEGGEGGPAANTTASASGGGIASASGTTLFAGGNGGGNVGGTTPDGSTGGGGAAGPGGDGRAAGRLTGTTGIGGSGGGGAGGGQSTKGLINATTTGGNGGKGPTNQTGGAGGANTVAGGSGFVGAGGGGGGGAANGGRGGNGQEYDTFHGAGGGGGGGGDSASVIGGEGGEYGGGGGGGGGCSATTCRGGDGLIIITYRPVTQITPTAVGTQTATLNKPTSGTTSTYIGGAFRLTTTSTTTLTSLGVTASTSSGAVTGLDDVKLYWDTAASCDTADPIATATLFNTASANFSSMKATISGSTAVTAGTPKCFYPAMDIGTTVTENLRFDIKIQAATDITTAISEVGTYPVEVSGVSVISTPASTISISGTCKQIDQTTNCTQGSKVARVAVNGNLQAQTDTTIAAGVWSITGVTQPATNDILTVFIETEGASNSQAVAITKYSGGGDVASVELIEGHLSIGSDQNNTITNANIALYDSSVSGKRTFHDVNGATLTVDADTKVANDELYIGAGDVYQPNAGGGDTTVVSDIEILGTITAEGNAFTASGSWDDNGTFTAGTSTLTMTGASKTLDASTFNNLTINSSGTVTTSGSFTVSGTLTSTAGTLSIPSGAVLTHSGATLTLSGTISGAGTLKETGSGFTFPTGGTISCILTMDTSAGNQTLSARTYGGAVNIDNSGATNGRTVTLGNGGTHTYSGALTILSSGTGSVELTGSANNPTVNITGDLTVTAGGGTKTITTGSGVWTASGNVNLTNGTFTASGGNRLVMNGASKTLTTASQTLRNVTLSGSITLAAATHTINGNLDMTGGTITATGSTVTMASVSASLIGGGNTLANLTIDPSSAGTITMSTSNLTASGTVTIAAGDKFAILTGRTLTLSGTGTPLSISGTFEPHSGSIVAYTGSSATVTSTTFGGLTLGGTGVYTLPSSGTPTIKGNLSVTSGATIASGSVPLLFRAGTTQSVSDANGTKQNLGEIRVTASTGGNTTLTLGSGIKIASATIDASQTLDFNGANTLTIQGSANALTNNGTFTASSGTVQYTAGSANVTAVVYNNLTLGGTGTYTLPATDVTLRGNLTVTSGAAVTKSASNKLIFAVGGGGSQTLTSNATNSDLGNIKVSANGGNSTLVLGSTVNLSSVSIDASQTLSAGSATMTLTGAGAVFINNGIFKPGSGTVQYTGTSALVGPSKYGNLTLGGTGTYTLPSSGTTTILGGLTLTSGSTVASGSSTLFFRGGTTQTVTDSTATKFNLGEIAVQASTGGNTTLALGSSVRIASATIDASQTLDFSNSNTLTITNAGVPFSVAGVITPRTGTTIFKGSGATSIPMTTYHHLKLQPPVNGATYTFLAGTASVSGTLTIGNGTNTGTLVTADTNASGLDVASVSISANSTLVANASQEFTVGGNWINNGEFTHSSGTVTFAFTRTASVSGATTFNHISSTAAGKKIKFKAGQTFTIAGDLTTTGAPGNPIYLESTSSTSQWLVNFTTPQSNLTYTTIRNAGCVGSITENMDSGLTGVVDGGNNGTCWFRVPNPGGNSGGGGFTGGGNSGGGAQQGGGGQGGGLGGGDGGQSGGGEQQGGGSQGGGGGATPVLYDLWLPLSYIFGHVI